MNKVVDIKIILVIFFLITTTARGQSNLLSDLISDFKLDSLGYNGLRKKHFKEVPFDSLEKHTKGEIFTFPAFFEGKSIIGESKEFVISLLGPPNLDSHAKKKRNQNNVKGKIVGTWRMTNDTLTIVAPKEKKKHYEYMHYYITPYRKKRLGSYLTISISDNKVMDAYFMIVT